MLPGPYRRSSASSRRRTLLGVRDASLTSFDASGDRLVATTFLERPISWDLSVEPPVPREFSRPGLVQRSLSISPVLRTVAMLPGPYRRSSASSRRRTLLGVRDASLTSFDASGDRLVATTFLERPISWDLSVEPPVPREFSRPGFVQYFGHGTVLINHTPDPDDPELPARKVLDPETLEDTGVSFEHPPQAVPRRGRSH